MLPNALDFKRTAELNIKTTASALELIKIHHNSCKQFKDVSSLKQISVVVHCVHCTAASQ